MNVSDLTPVYVIVTIFVLFILLAVYFIPAIIAFARDNPYKKIILVLNIFSGWTCFLWVGALIWACWPLEDLQQRYANSAFRKNKGPLFRSSYDISTSKLNKLEKLGSLRQSGILTEEEFQFEKARILSEQ